MMPGPVAILWDRLEAIADRIDVGLASEYAHVVRYPAAGLSATPPEIILADADGGAEIFRSSGQHGTRTVLLGTECRHPKALEALGAQKASDLTPEGIVDLLQSVADIGSQIGRPMAETAVRLLGRLYDLDPNFDLGRGEVWPVRRGEEYRLSTLESCYLRDHPLARHFGEEITFLFDRSDGIVQPKVRDLALYQEVSPQSFSDALVAEEAEMGTVEADQDGTRRFRLMARALRASFPVAYSAEPASVDWLSSVNVYDSETLRIRLKVGRVEKSIEPPSAVWLANGETGIYKLNAHPMLYDNLASDIILECEDRGLEVVDAVLEETRASAVLRAEVEGKVYRLLTRSPTEWHYFIDELDPIDEWLPPLMDIDLEVRPGYLRTRQKLMDWYGYCQIDGNRTPKSEHAGETCEQVKSIVSMRGGRYRGHFHEYQTSNCLFLCPRHHTLYERKLVRFPDLESALTDRGTGAEGLRRMASDWEGEGIRVEVFEGLREDPEPRWHTRTLFLHPEHASETFDWLADWVGSGENGQ